MEEDQLINLLLEETKGKIENHEGLTIFAKERAKFEGWLKVELISILLKNNVDALPEDGRIDITFDDHAIELKTINTNYRFDTAVNKHRPITKNIDDTLTDIYNLNLLKIQFKYVIFVVFPLDTEINKEWNYHLEKIKEKVKELHSRNIIFKNKVPGAIYLGVV